MSTMSKHHDYRWTLTLLALFAMPQATRAGLVVERSGSLAPTKTVQAGANAGPLQSQGLGGSPIGLIHIEKFDTLGGLRELTGVSVVVQGEIRNEGYFHFISPNTTIGVSVQASDVQVRLLPGGPVFNVPLAFDHTTYESTTPTELVRPGIPKRVDLPLTQREGYASDASEADPFQFSEPEDLAAFVGSGSLEIPVFASALATFASSTGNGDAVINTFAGARVSIRYNFRDTPRDTPIPVPEPASILTGLIGAAAVATIRRRARRRHA